MSAIKYLITTMGSVGWAFMICSACGQDYPSKPVRIVTSEAGGGGDYAARLIAQGLTANMGQQMLVDNRPGGIIPIEYVAKSPPDGYTVLVFGSSLWIAPLLRSSVPYDVVRDFAPVTLAASAPNILVVHPSLPVKSVKELIALAKARPGMLNYSAAVTGSSSHIAAELFKSMAGVNIAHVPYKGAGQAVSALLGGEVQVMIPSAGSVAPHVKSGRLRVLAVTSAQPSQLVPGVPTVAAAGVPGYESVQTYGVLVVAKTPAAIISRLHREIVRVLSQADAKEKLLGAGVEPIANSPEEFAAAMRSEMARVGKVVKEAGIRVE